MTRKITKKIQIGSRVIGGGEPILVQSMTCTPTTDFEATLAQIRSLEEAGCDIVRFTVPDHDAVRNIARFKENTSIPLVADIHFDHRLAVAAIEAGADKVRINPGNIGSEEGVKKVNVLSGGERVRCMLSKMMISGANVLMFDEPTDHLDMESITALNNGMKKFPGVMIFSSRDHQVVETTANRIMEIINGQLVDKITTYDEYLASDEMARKRFTYTVSELQESDN